MSRTAVDVWTPIRPVAILLAMRTPWEGSLIGTFLGYKGGRTYELSDGSAWVQEDNTDEPVYRENPTARLFWNQSLGQTYLDVEGTSAVVRVTRRGDKPRPHSGAF